MSGDGGEGLRAEPSLKVSVVVPVYNPGQYIEPLIESLLAQTLPIDEFEAIFVDDGSSDKTPARLDALAAEHPHLRVIHQPNSGWPGKPRNVGIDAANGEFIQFVDHDDYLARDALARLYDRAIETSADVVIGKVVSLGRKTPMDAFWERRDALSIATYPLESTLTPHKLFRASMLREKNIRYLEGKRRLEDNPFVLESYFAARNVAVLAESPCYYFTKRSDGGNHSSDWSDPADYYRSLRDSLDVVEKNTEPGALRDRLLRHFYNGKMLGRLREPKILSVPSDYGQQVLDQVRILIDERLPESVFHGLSFSDRLRTALVREGRLDDLVTMARRCTEVQLWTDLKRADWSSDNALHLEFAAWLGFADRTPVLFTPEQGGFGLDPRIIADLFGPDAVELTTEEEIQKQTSLRLLLHDIRTKVTWQVPCTVSVQLVPGEGAEGPDARWVRFVCTAVIDPRTVRGGKALTPDTWALRVNASVCGLRRGGALKTLGELELPPNRVPVRKGVFARAFLAKSGNLRLRVNGKTSPRPPEAPTSSSDASRLGRAADLILRPLPAKRAARYRAQLKRMARKVTS